MVRTYRTADPERLELIAVLEKHPGMVALVEEILAAREAYFANLAKGLALRTEPVDQREIDEKRGFWKGAVWALKVFPKQTSKNWERFVEAALTEDGDKVA